MTWLALVLDALAVYRLTRLVTKDTLTQAPRDRLIRWSYLRWSDDVGADEVADDVIGSGSLQAMVEADMDDGTAPKLAELIVCRWCASAYVAMLVVCMRWIAPTVWDPIAWGCTLWAGGALLARLED